MHDSTNATAAPGRALRRVARRTAAGSAWCIRMNRPTTASKGASSIGSPSSATRKDTFVAPRAAARRRACSAVSGLRSIPTTAPEPPTRSAARIATSPEPLPRSRTRIPGPMPASWSVRRVTPR